MEPNVNQTNSPAPVEPVTSTTPPVTASAPNANVIKAPSESGGSKKKPLMIAVVVVIVLLILGAVGYYFYSTMKAKPAEQPPTSYVAPTETPAVTVAPTQSSNAITDSSQLDGVVKDIDSATDEASMNKEINSLKTDSSF